MRIALMQIKMAALNRSLFAGLLYFGLLFIISVNSKTCDYKVCIQKHVRSDKIELPDCVHKSKLLTCLENMAESEQCPEDIKQNGSNVLHRYAHGFSLLESTLCRNHELFLGYKNKKDCWMPAVQCSQVFHFAAPKTKLIGTYCKERHFVVDDCKNMGNINLIAECKDLHSNLLDAMFKASPCKGCTLTVQTIVLGLGILMAIVWNNMAIYF